MIRVDVTRIDVYCDNFFAFVRHGREGGPEGGIEWIEACDWCLRRQRSTQAEVARLEALCAARTCEAPRCSVVFTPARRRAASALTAAASGRTGGRVA